MKPLRVPHAAVFATLLVLPHIPSGAQEPKITATATPDRHRLRLSESLRVLLVVEGPAPLRVQLPAELLTPECRKSWEIHPDPEWTARIEPGVAGSERWSQRFRLDPYPPGASLVFTPISVNGTPTEVQCPLVTVELPTLLKAPREKARPVTGIEELPDSPDPDTRGTRFGPVMFLTLVVAAGLVAAVGWLLIRLWRTRTRPQLLSPCEWALAEVARLEQDVVAGMVPVATLADRLATVLRGYVERRFVIPTGTRTTAELIGFGRRSGWPSAFVNTLAHVLNQCDRFRFGGEFDTAAEFRALQTEIAAWLTTLGTEEDPPRRKSPGGGASHAVG